MKKLFILSLILVGFAQTVNAAAADNKGGKIELTGEEQGKLWGHIYWQSRKLYGCPEPGSACYIPLGAVAYQKGLYGSAAQSAQSTYSAFLANPAAYPELIAVIRPVQPATVAAPASTTIGAAAASGTVETKK